MVVGCRLLRRLSPVDASHSLLLSSIASSRNSLPVIRLFHSTGPLRRANDADVKGAKEDNSVVAAQGKSSVTAGNACAKDSWSAEVVSSESDSEAFSQPSSLSSSSQTWEDDPDWSIDRFSQLPHQGFGYNQHIKINEDFKECLRQMLWTFRAPIRYAFAYGSGVFSQASSSSSSVSLPSPHAHPPEAIARWQRSGGKVIDFIFGVTHTHHWHALNIAQNPHHYSFLRNLGSGAVSRIQDDWGAGVYFNPYVILNGTMIKYGVVNLATLRRDLSQWDTLYLAGRLQKPVKILRDDPKIRMANQLNLISALRTALLMLGPSFSERDLYTKIASISYMGDPRMQFKGEDPNKTRNIVHNQIANFRQLYAPLVDALPNVYFNDSCCQSKDWLLDSACDCGMVQDMDPQKRGNMVRRLPLSFRNSIYMEYRKKWQIPGNQFDTMMQEAQDENEAGFKRPSAASFDRRIASETDLSQSVANAVRSIVKWPSYSQSIKGLFTGGLARSWRYASEKLAKGRASTKKSG